MEEKRNYVVYYVDNRYNDEVERIIKITETQAKVIDWFMNNFDINGCIELVENYEGEEI